MAKAYTYDDKSVREDLIDVITNVDPTENQFQSGIGKTSAQSRYHEWTQDTLKTVGTNAQIEGSDATYNARTNPTRSANHTQILRVDFDVTDTEREVNNAGFKDRYAYEMDKAMTEFSNDLEYALVRGSLATGTGSAARSMAGLLNVITTNATTVNTGTTFDETILNNLVQLAWGTGGRPDAIYVGATLKRRISSFTAGTTKFTDATDKRITNSVGVYEGDFGVQKVFLHRYITASPDTLNNVAIIQEDTFKLASLRPAKHIPLAKTGSSTKGMIEGELTLEYRAEKASALGKSYS